MPFLCEKREKGSVSRWYNGALELNVMVGGVCSIRTLAMNEWMSFNSLGFIRLSWQGLQSYRHFWFRIYGQYNSKRHLGQCRKAQTLLDYCSLIQWQEIVLRLANFSPSESKHQNLTADVVDCPYVFAMGGQWSAFRLQRCKPYDDHRPPATLNTSFHQYWCWCILSTANMKYEEGLSRSTNVGSRRDSVSHLLRQIVMHRGSIIFPRLLTGIALFSWKASRVSNMFSYYGLLSRTFWTFATFLWDLSESKFDVR